MMKRIALLMTLLLTLCMFLTGCGNEDNGNKIKILLSEEPSGENALLKAMNQWASETGHEIETVVIPYDDQLTKFPLMLKNHDVPDLVSTTRLTRLYPDEFMDLSEKIDTSSFDPVVMAIVGQDYGSSCKLELPDQYTVSCWYYNKDAFDKAGIEAPTVEKPWTMDELIANAKKLKELGIVKYGMAVDFSRARYDNFMYSSGGSITVKTDNSYAVAVNSEKNIDTLTEFVTLNQDGILPKVIWTGGSNDNPADYFKNGDVGIYLSGSWNYHKFSKDIQNFQFGVMPSPKGSVSSSAILGGDGLAIPKDAKNSESAIEFMKWFYQEDHYKSYLANDKGLSFIKGVAYMPDDPKMEADYKIMLSEVRNVTQNFMVDEESAWRNYLDNEYRDTIKKAVNGELTPKEALDSFAQALAKKAKWKLAE